MVVEEIWTVWESFQRWRIGRQLRSCRRYEEPQRSLLFRQDSQI
ncbi:unnamed protein product [Brassica oleracea var. botrytis]